MYIACVCLSVSTKMVYLNLLAEAIFEFRNIAERKNFSGSSVFSYIAKLLGLGVFV